jgi:hypothetical protein
MPFSDEFYSNPDLTMEDREAMRAIGSDWYYYGDTEQIQGLLEYLISYGTEEDVASCLSDMQESINHWESFTYNREGYPLDYHIAYNDVAERWYCVENGWWTPDPYVAVRED